MKDRNSSKPGLIIWIFISWMVQHHQMTLWTSSSKLLRSSKEQLQSTVRQVLGAQAP